MKIVGLWDFSLHELVIHERIEVIDKRINEITVGRKAQPALLNQYNTEGKIKQDNYLKNLSKRFCVE